MCSVSYVSNQCSLPVLTRPVPFNAPDLRANTARASLTRHPTPVDTASNTESKSDIMPNVSPEKSFVEDGAVWGRLELSMTPGESTVYELRGNQSQVVGRASGCDVRVDLPHISGSHCTVRPSGTSEEGQYCAKIRDISSNGTVVNGAKLRHNKKVRLSVGDKVTFGSKRYSEARYRLSRERPAGGD